MGGVMAATARMDAFGIDPSTTSTAALNNISPLKGAGDARNGSADRNAASWSDAGSGLGEDPYAWANNLGGVPDKDALAAMEDGQGYLAAGGAYHLLTLVLF
jgi:hypothetical protein